MASAPRTGAVFCCPAQIRVAACGRRWGKTEALSIDIASLALDETNCRQLVVAPTDAQARLLGNEVLLRLLDAWEWRDADGQAHPSVAGREITVRQRPALSIVLTRPNPATSRDPSLLGKGEEREEVSIHFRTAGRDGRGIRGLWAHRIVADEAARVPDTVLTDVLLPMLADKGGDYVLASSPAGRRSAYYRLYAKGNPPGTSACPPETGRRGGKRRRRPDHLCVVPVSDVDNPHLSHAFLQAQREELGRGDVCPGVRGVVRG